MQILVNAKLGMRTSLFLFLPTLFLIAANEGLGQEKGKDKLTREQLIAAAREVMAAAGNCALITIDESGEPRVRVMDPFPPDSNMIVWLGTNPNSRKVEQIRNNPHVNLFYFDASGQGYVTIAGTARLVDDPEEKNERWKTEWEAFYPNHAEAYLLIEVTPDWLEVLSGKHGISGDAKTWKPPTVVFHAYNSKD